MEDLGFVMDNQVMYGCLLYFQRLFLASFATGYCQEAVAFINGDLCHNPIFKYK